MNSTMKKLEISKHQRILDNLVDYTNLLNTPILELSRKIDSLIIDYYNEMDKNIVNSISCKSDRQINKALSKCL